MDIIKTGTMKHTIQTFIRRHTRLTLTLVFLFVVFLPGIVLGVLAFRALDREEAFIEKSLEASMLAEVDSSVSLIRNKLDLIVEELDRSLTVPKQFIPFKPPENEAERNPLAGLLFAVSNNKEMLWPKSSNTLSEQEKLFLYYNSALFTDSVTIPIVKNITQEYKEEIIKSPKGLINDTDTAADTNPESAHTESKTETEQKNKQQPVTESVKQDNAGTKDMFFSAADASETSGDSVPSDITQSKPSAPEPLKSSISTSKAKKVFSNEKKEEAEVLKNFEENAPIRDKVYEQAKKEGAQVMKRNTVVENQTTDIKKEERSVFILSPGTFSDITKGARRGLFPRIIGDNFELLFWKKTIDGHILGCVIDEELLRDRIISILPEEVNSQRILTVLDENALPITEPGSVKYDINWRQPFVAREIDEALPRWEVAAYISDPDYIHSEAVSTTNTLWVIISALLFFLLVGGIIIITFLMSEIRLAEQKTSFVANVSHELKTPLTSIRLFAEMLVNGVRTAKKKQEEYLKLMLEETERLSRLIGNVLDFQAMNQNKKRYNIKQSDYVACLSGVIEKESLRLEKEGISLRFTTRLKTLHANFCPESIARVIINLISNAEKYAASGREITVSLEKSEINILICVMDRGPGIPPWAVKKIFKAFYRIDDSTEARTQGSGLGLAIVNRIIRDHKGSISVQQRKGGGAVFCITLPLKGNRRR